MSIIFDRTGLRKHQRVPSFPAKLSLSLFLPHNYFELKRLYLVFFLLFTCILQASAQTDTVVKPAIDTVQIKIDSVHIKDSLWQLAMADSVVKRPPARPETWHADSLLPVSVQILRRHPYFPFGATPVRIHEAVHSWKGKDMLFYAIIGLLLIFALLRNGFAKYFSDLFRVFFRTTLKQRQIREQLMQTPLPSVLFNAFFSLSAGMYIVFMLLYFKKIAEPDFWRFYLYAIIGLSVIYFVKYAGLKILGWIFNLQEAADTYTFIVFIINKVVGVFLLPFLPMLAFMDGTGYQVALVLSWCGLGALYMYRFILAFAAVRNEVRFNLFHFLLYLCAFEVAPLLLIYKLLLVFFR